MNGMTGSSGNNSAGQIMTSNAMGSPFDNILNGGDWNTVGGSGSGSGLSGTNTMSATQSQDPLSNLMDSVNSLDPLNSMGKSLNEQMNSLVNSASLNNAGILLGPGSGNSLSSTGNNSNSTSAQGSSHRSSLHAPQTPSNMLNMGHQQQQQTQQQQQQQAIRNDTLAQLDLSSDLNFDPAAVIDGGGEGQEGLNVSSNYLENQTWFSITIIVFFPSCCRTVWWTRWIYFPTWTHPNWRRLHPAAEAASAVAATVSAANSAPEVCASTAPTTTCWPCSTNFRLRLV